MESSYDINGSNKNNNIRVNTFVHDVSSFTISCI
jgi:hypothetical protein